jgi:hypothetical protein
MRTFDATPKLGIEGFVEPNLLNGSSVKSPSKSDTHFPYRRASGFLRLRLHERQFNAGGALKQTGGSLPKWRCISLLRHLNERLDTRIAA